MVRCSWLKWGTERCWLEKEGLVCLSACLPFLPADWGAGEAGTGDLLVSHKQRARSGITWSIRVPLGSGGKMMLQENHECGWKWTQHQADFQGTLPFFLPSPISLCHSVSPYIPLPHSPASSPSLPSTVRNRLWPIWSKIYLISGIFVVQRISRKLENQGTQRRKNSKVNQIELHTKPHSASSEKGIRAPYWAINPVALHRWPTPWIPNTTNGSVTFAAPGWCYPGLGEIIMLKGPEGLSPVHAPWVSQLMLKAGIVISDCDCLGLSNIPIS